MEKLFYVFVLSISSLTTTAWAQECDSTKRSSTPIDNFYINEDGTVTELERGLTWQRCSVGQNWDGKVCIGEAKRFSWTQAVTELDRISNSHWRLPSLPELASIVEIRCTKPRINQTLFPDTPAGLFWTANHKKGTKDEAFALDFSTEGVTAAEKNKGYFVRLVSGRD